MKACSHLGSTFPAKYLSLTLHTMKAPLMRPSRTTLGLILACLGAAAGCDTGSKTVVHTAPPSPTVRTVVVQAPSVPAALGNRATPTPAPTPVPTPTPPPPPIAPTATAQPPASVDPSATVAIPVAPPLPGPVADVVQLTRGGLDEGVVSEYIGNIREPFALGAAQIVYLNDLGVSSNVIHRLMRKAAEIRPDASAPSAQVAPATPTAGAPYSVAPPAANPQTVVTTLEGTPPPPPTSAVTTVVAAPVPPTVVNQQVFYQSLSPYGSWMDVPGYGWCWRPSVAVANTSWQPYCDGGSWLWTDAGWYWNSTYTWGWAPYHYGRWHQHARFGWVWNPGYDWAPAWVAWRSSPTYCGWAPLPPECRWNASVGFSWVNGNSAVSIGFGIGSSAWYATTWDRFCDPHLYHHRLPRQRAEQFVRESNVQVANGQGVNIRGNNNTVIINNGITREEVQRHSREEIKRTELRDVNSPAAAQSFASSRPNPSGGRPAEVAVYRPTVPVHDSRPPESVLKRPEISRMAPPSSSSSSMDRIGIATPNSRPLTVPSGGGSLNPNRPANIPANIPAAGLAPSSSPNRPAPVPAGIPSERMTQTLPPTTRPSSSVPSTVAPRISTTPSTPTPTTPTTTRTTPATTVATPSRPSESRGTPIPRTESSAPSVSPSSRPIVIPNAGVPSRPASIQPTPSASTFAPAPSAPAIGRQETFRSAPAPSGSPSFSPSPAPSITLPPSAVQSRPIPAAPAPAPTSFAPPAPSAPPIARQEAFRSAPAPAASPSFSPSPAPSITLPPSAIQSRPIPAGPAPAPFAPAPTPSFAPSPRPSPAQIPSAPSAPSFQPSPRPAPAAAPSPGPAPSGRPGQRGPIER